MKNLTKLHIKILLGSQRGNSFSGKQTISNYSVNLKIKLTTNKNCGRKKRFSKIG